MGKPMPLSWERTEKIGPREKILLHGGDSLSDAELIAILIGSGTRALGAGELAARLLKDADGLRGLSTRKGNELMDLTGMGPARAARLMAVFSLARRLNAMPLWPGFKVRSSRDVFAHYSPLLRDRKKEVFIVLLLDSKNRLLREERISEGSLTASIVHPREVFQAAIRESAAAILALHNHPSGDPSPSREDYDVTRRLKDVGDLVGIGLVDHVILGEGRFISFREHKLMDWTTE
ncbi:MAG: RadC family protein [Planctomycetota bacterium]|jgi:DNA repair protein RadC